LDGSTPGDVGFDPLGLSNTEVGGVDLYFIREAELKHSRVAMMAVVGVLALENGFVFPSLPYTDGENAVDSFYAVVKSNPALVVSSFILIGMVELISGIAITEGKKSGLRGPGEFGFNPLKFGRSKETKNDLSAKEIKNGRLAMISSAGILAQESLSHDKAVEAFSNFVSSL
jgi:light-harvesting complex I chlorophyll a/b binding protein 1